MNKNKNILAGVRLNILTVTANQRVSSKCQNVVNCVNQKKIINKPHSISVQRITEELFFQVYSGRATYSLGKPVRTIQKALLLVVNSLGPRSEFPWSQRCIITTV
jgi:hypothetical protein